MAMGIRYAVTALFTLASLAAAARPRVEHGRYYSPGGEFSIEVAQFFRPSKDYSKGGLVVVDFPFQTPATIYGFAALRTVEWKTMDHDIGTDQYQSLATAMIEDTKAHRFADQHFEVTKSALVSYDAVPALAFVAVGHQREAWYVWHGLCLFKGNHAALVSHVNSAAGIVKVGDLAIPAPGDSFTKWALSIRPEI